ncbi:N-acetyltransferase [Paenibacillus sp. 3LSP]|uniref:GNAT family N-acetyltransferase n=1 Tax=Paenibacillus TaxID=44249 RepID=UPI00048FAA4A|nr:MULTISPECIES: N-acetyltransferase [Paenibacillus]MDU0331832.1 N-acetyltransferase [Paenibacillus sp. 3LSP]MEC2343672.1 N-acetyltransferase [Paenibacillus barengoltzii]
MIIRAEEPRDARALFALHFQAFGEREDESKLVDRIRNSPQYIPSLSLVAEHEGQIVGHALFSKAEAVGKEQVSHEVVVLAPLAVSPSFQKQGIGTQLIQEGLQRTQELGYGVVFLIGHPEYYPRFGFKPARSLGFELKQFEVPDEVFMAMELKEGATLSIQGELLYPEAFFEK